MSDPRVGAFLERVAQARRAAGISQAEMAQRLSMHQTNYARLERGSRGVSLIDAYAIADAFGVDLLDLLAGKRLRIRGTRIVKRAEDVTVTVP